MESRVTLVTGGTGALGTAVCERLLVRGDRVHATYVDARERERFAAALGPRAAEVRLHAVDLLDESAVALLFDEVARAEGVLDGVACIAGGFAMGPLEETSLATLDAMLSTNLRTAFVTARAAVRRMRPRGRGRIVAVGSRAALEPGPHLSAYVASKAALHGFVRALAAELRGSGVTINAVVPETIDTPANRAAMPGADPTRWASPADVAELVAFLLSDASAVTSGALIPAYGR
jgi:NAD(P)-dependent dehydrogenase (short-subunit alcohol dehydrogenase family)